MIDSSSSSPDVVILQQRVHELEQALTALNNLVSRLDQCIWSMDFATLRYLLVSPACERIYGYPPAAFLADQSLLYTCTYPDDRRIVDSINTDVVQGKSCSLEHRIVRRDGTIGWVVSDVKPMCDEQGQVVQLHGIITDVTARKEAAAEHAQMQATLISLQAAMLAELSTPLIPVTNEIVVMPLVGALDTQRVQRVLETLLQGIEQHHAHTAIIDITGVPIVDTQVANTLIQAALAVRLLGAEVVLTGIRPEVAQTLVTLGVDLRNIVTKHSLHSGIAYATAT